MGDSADHFPFVAPIYNAVQTQVEVSAFLNFKHNSEGESSIVHALGDNKLGTIAGRSYIFWINNVYMMKFSKESICPQKIIRDLRNARLNTFLVWSLFCGSLL